ncbi:hypothetical protein ABBQ32_012330 [Trebouxia sp. C0010 RCD-2024]
MKLVRRGRQVDVQQLLLELLLQFMFENGINFWYTYIHILGSRDYATAIPAATQHQPTMRQLSRCPDTLHVPVPCARYVLCTWIILWTDMGEGMPGSLGFRS